MAFRHKLEIPEPDEKYSLLVESSYNSKIYALFPAYEFIMLDKFSYGSTKEFSFDNELDIGFILFKVSLNYFYDGYFFNYYKNKIIWPFSQFSWTSGSVTQQLLNFGYPVFNSKKTDANLILDTDVSKNIYR